MSELKLFDSANNLPSAAVYILIFSPLFFFASVIEGLCVLYRKYDFLKNFSSPVEVEIFFHTVAPADSEDGGLGSVPT